MNDFLHYFMLPQTVGALIAIALILTAIVCIVQLIRTPPKLKRRFDRAVRRCGLRNAQKEYPTLVSVRRDKNKSHGMVLRVWNRGISIPDMDRQYERMKASLNGIIYNMEYGERSTDFTLLYFLPQKYITPTLLVPTDDAIGSLSINRLINMLVVGATGTGKTVAIKIIMAKIFYCLPTAKVWLLDFKQFDFRFLSGATRYFGFTDCLRGLEEFYAAFKRQQQTGVAGVPQFLIIDEWGSFISAISASEKKAAEQMKIILAELLMLGRAYRFYLIVGIQRPDAAYFAGARDNFQCCLALGNLSAEGRRMVFPDSVAERITECHKREGHIYIDGMGLDKIRIADISDMDELDAVIKELMNR